MFLVWSVAWLLGCAVFVVQRLGMAMSAGEGAGTKKRRQFRLDEKMKIISGVQGGRKKKDVADEYGISASTLSTFLKDKEKMQGQVAQHQTDPSRKRIRTATFQDVDAASTRGLPVYVQGRFLSAGRCCVRRPNSLPSPSAWMKRTSKRRAAV